MHPNALQNMRANGRAIYLAQPEGLGWALPMVREGQRPDRLILEQIEPTQMAGPLVLVILSCDPTQAVGLG